MPRCRNWSDAWRQMLKQHRLFFALWPDDATRAALAVAADQVRQRLHPEGQWRPPDTYHMTLHYLGAEEAFPDSLVQRALAAAGSVRSLPFRLHVDRVGGFPRGSTPWWLGTSVPPPELRRLWLTLKNTLRAASVRPIQQSFTPHLTILYKAAQVLPPSPVPATDWAIDEFALLHGETGKPGYQVLGRWPLAAGTESEPVIQRTRDTVSGTGGAGARALRPLPHPRSATPCRGRIYGKIEA